MSQGPLLIRECQDSEPQPEPKFQFNTAGAPLPDTCAPCPAGEEISAAPETGAGAPAQPGGDVEAPP